MVTTLEDIKNGAGRGVEEIIVVNAVAIVDTTSKQFSVDLSKYKSAFFIAETLLDQPVSVSVYVNNSMTNYYFNDEGESKSAGGFGPTLTTIGAYMLNSHPAFKFINLNGMKTVRIRVKCDVAPTTGALTVRVWGVPN